MGARAVSGRVAIANRGEIAVRIAATCRLRGLEPVLLIGEPDRDGLAARQIGRVEILGPAGSELEPDRVVAAAVRVGATFLHPGYGFLSERPTLAQACDDAGIRFVGPSAATLKLCGDKVATRTAAEKAGVPVLPASPPLGDDPAGWHQAAEVVGYPVLVKAAAGGGGASLRRVERSDLLQEAIASSRREAEAAGAGPVLYLERLLEDARHIEVQVAGDGQRWVAIGERECSLQRRHQKVIEEAPAPNLPEAARERLFAHAVAIAEAVGLVNLATVEFLYGQDETIAFLEVNPRLQVEHPVTEATTGLDLVGLQLDLAAGEPLPHVVPAPHGHAIEARLYAEDPNQHFLPSPGLLRVLAVPDLPQLRVDAGYQAGDTVPDRYDPLLAKMIAWGQSRDEAVARLRDGLSQTHVAGVATNQSWLLALLDNEAVRCGRYTTTTALQESAPPAPPSRAAEAALVATALDRPPTTDPWEQIGPFRLTGGAEITFHGVDGDWEIATIVERVGERWQLQWAEGRAPLEWWRGADGVWTVRCGEEVGSVAVIRHEDGSLEVAAPVGRWRARPGRKSSGAARAERRADGTIRAPLPGKVVRVPVQPGTLVTDGAPVVILSAMKIEVVLHAPGSGRIAAIHCEPGQQVDAGDILIEVALEEGE